MWKISKVKAPFLLFILGILEILHFGKITITFFMAELLYKLDNGFLLIPLLR